MIHRRKCSAAVSARSSRSGRKRPPARTPTHGLAEIPIRRSQPNPFQPRKTFNEASIDELARSVREHGIVQPLVVTRSGDKYKLIAGERRFRAAQKAGLTTVPVVIKEMMAEGDALQIALIENIQREDLNPIEEAMAYHQLHEEFGLTQEEISSASARSARPSPTSCACSSCPIR